METIRTKEFEGKTVITAIDRLNVDPEATKKQAQELLEKTKIYQKYMKIFRDAQKQKENISKRIEAVNASVKAVEDRLELTDLPPYLKIAVAAQKGKKEYGDYLEVLRKQQMERRSAIIEIQQAGKKIQSLSGRIRDEKKQIILDNPVYFELRKGEQYAEDGELEEIRKKVSKLKKGQYLTLNGEVIGKKEG